MKRTSQISTYAISVTSTKFLEVLELVALGISPSGIRGIRLHFEKVNFCRAISFHASVRAATICEVAHEHFVR